MTLKAKAILFFIISMLLTGGFLTLLAFAFFNGFTAFYILGMLGGMVLTIIMWNVYYMALTKYNESRSTDKHKYFKKGNRKNTRKAGKSRTASRQRAKRK